MNSEIDNIIKLNELKFELKKNLKLKNIAKKEKRTKELRCFWSWPFGHLWRRNGYGGDVKCEVCEKIFQNNS